METAPQPENKSAPKQEFARPTGDIEIGGILDTTPDVAEDSLPQETASEIQDERSGTRVMQAFAAEMGSTFESDPVTAAVRYVRFNCQDIACQMMEIESQDFPMGLPMEPAVSTCSTVLAAMYRPSEAHAEYALQIGEETLFTSIMEAFRIRDARCGHDDFDSKMHIKTSDTELTAAILSNSALRQALMDLAEVSDATLEIGPGFDAGNPDNTHTFIQLALNREVADRDEAMRLHAIFTMVVGAVKESGACAGPIS